MSAADTPMLTTREVAERLSVSTETVLRWMRRGVLPAVRLPGGAVRFDPRPLTHGLPTELPAPSPEPLTPIRAA